MNGIDVGQGDEIAEATGQVLKRAFLKYRLSVLEDVITRANSLPCFTDRDEMLSTKRAVDEMLAETQAAIENDPEYLLQREGL